MDFESMRGKRVFISHNSQWDRISDFAELIRQLGYYPVVVEKEPDRGKDPNAKSKHYLYQSDIVIFVITRDSVDGSGTPHPKSNVAIEIGLAEDRFPREKKIFFVEEGAKPPTMVTQTYIPVINGNYYVAISALIMNIRNAIPYGKEASQSNYSSPELSAIAEYIIKKLTETADSALLRPELSLFVTKQLGIKPEEFNITLKVLQKKKLVRLGEMGYGSGHYGEYYVELTPSGVDVGLKLAGRERQL